MIRNRLPFGAVVWRRATLLTLMVAGAASGQEGVVSQTAPLTWRGCGITQQAFMRACADAYTAETGQAVVVSGGGAALGIRAAAGGSADLGGTCRHCLPSQYESERGVKSVVIAWDALVAVTHPSNPVDRLTREQLVRALRGEVTNWAEFGGEDQRIILMGRKGNESGVGVMMRLLILGDADFEFPPGTVLHRSTRPLEQLLERTPGGLALTGVSSAKKRSLKVLDIDGVEPSAVNIAAGEYPYFRPLYLTYREDTQEHTPRFIAWIQGESAQRVIGGEGTVTLEMGLPLMEKYQHWHNTQDITNYASLMARAANRAVSGAGREANP